MLEKQAGTSTFQCPTCMAPLWSMAPDGAVTVHADLQRGDGDVIPGSPATLAGYACAVMAYVQSCPFCQGRYWTLDLCAHTEGQNSLLDMMAWGLDEGTCFTFADTRGAISAVNIAPTYEPINRHPNGLGITIMAGPYPVGVSDVTHGPNGVSACGGGMFWQKAKSFLFANLSTFESAVSESVKLYNTQQQKGNAMEMAEQINPDGLKLKEAIEKLKLTGGIPEKRLVLTQEILDAVEDQSDPDAISLEDARENLAFFLELKARKTIPDDAATEKVVNLLKIDVHQRQLYFFLESEELPEGFAEYKEFCERFKAELHLRMKKNLRDTFEVTAKAIAEPTHES